MIRYLRAEHLKFKRSFSRKVLVAVPILVLLFSFFMNPIYTVTNTFNWWSIFFMPLTIALLCGLSHQKEQQAVNYNRIFSLPVSLTRVWYAKMGVIALYVLVMLLFFEVLLTLLQMIFPLQSDLQHTWIAVYMLWIGTLWQIPLCLWLARKWGMITALLLNAGIGITLGTYAAPLGWWWLNPWSWSIRMMCPAIGVHPNGIPLAAGDPLQSAAVIPAGLLLSVSLFLIIAGVTGRAFAGHAHRSVSSLEVN